MRARALWPDADDDVADRVAALDVAVGLDDVLEREGPVEHGAVGTALEAGPEVLEPPAERRVVRLERVLKFGGVFYFFRCAFHIP